MLGVNTGDVPYPTIEKEWGKSQRVSRLNGVDTYHIAVMPDGYCSIHRHIAKNNLFYLLTGQLRIFSGNMNGYLFVAEMVVDLLPGEQYIVPAGMWHYFRAGSSPTDALEVYWAETSDDDIVRLSPGGVGN